MDIIITEEQRVKVVTLLQRLLNIFEKGTGKINSEVVTKAPSAAETDWPNENEMEFAEIFVRRMTDFSISESEIVRRIKLRDIAVARMCLELARKRQVDDESGFKRILALIEQWQAELGPQEKGTK